MTDIKKKIEELIKAEYKAYGFDGRAEVVVIETGEITIYLNHEIPYMGSKFWEFLRTLKEKLASDYEEKTSSFFYSYYIMSYVKK